MNATGVIYLQHSWEKKKQKTKPDFSFIWWSKMLLNSISSMTKCFSDFEMKLILDITSPGLFVFLDITAPASGQTLRMLTMIRYILLYSPYLISTVLMLSKYRQMPSGNMD